MNRKIWFEHPFLKVDYKLFWIILACLNLASSQVVINTFNAESYFFTRLIYVFSITLWPLLYVYIYNSFCSLLVDKIYSLFWEDCSAAKGWLDKTLIPIFMLKDKKAKLVYLFISLSIPAVIVYIGLPYSIPVLRTLTMIGMTEIAFISGYGVILLLTILYSFYKLSKMPNNLQFYKLDVEETQQIKKYFLKVSVMITVIYSLLIVGNLFGPYKRNIWIQVYLLILAFIPSGLYISTFLFSYRIERKAKMDFIRKFDSVYFKEIFDIDKIAILQINEYKEIMEFRNYVLGYKFRNSGFNLNFLISILALVISPATQLFIALHNSGI